MIEESLAPVGCGLAAGNAVSSRAEAAAPASGRKVFIGTAGWSVPSQYAAQFCTGGTHLERYATRLNGVEINSSFYRPHRRQTYARWARCVPEHFRFAVKIPKEITHERRLVDCADLLDRFAFAVSGLGPTLGVVLVQLPPSLAFGAACANRFFEALRMRIDGGIGVCCEPRHASWFTETANTLLEAHEIARVAADPPRSQGAAQPAGWRGLAYYRLHGSPRMYYSNYDADALERSRRDLAVSGVTAAATWCIFDNTAAFAALGNALALTGMNPAARRPASQS